MRPVAELYDLEAVAKYNFPFFSSSDWTKKVERRDSVAGARSAF
jgi:hypothetical protein